MLILREGHYVHTCLGCLQVCYLQLQWWCQVFWVPRIDIRVYRCVGTLDGVQKLHACESRVQATI